MMRKWTVGAQLSTSHSSPDALGLGRALEAAERVRREIELDLLIVGSREAPEIFRGVCGPRRPASDVFLWYNVLSDIDEMEDSDLVVNWRGERSCGWGGWAERGAEVDEHSGSPVRTIRLRDAKRFGVSLNSLVATPSLGYSSTRYAFLLPPTASTRCFLVSAIIAVARLQPSTLISMQ